MSAELKAIAQSLIDQVWNGGNLAAIDQFYAPTVVRRQPPFPPVEGLAAYRAFLTTTFATFANLHMTATEMVVEGDTVVLYGTWRAQQIGPLAWADLPARGKSFEVAYCTILHFQAGKVVEELVYVDQWGLVQQLQIRG
ncbi:MAG: ester cyclase [Caldilineaceae bacterium]